MKPYRVFWRRGVVRVAVTACIVRAWAARRGYRTWFSRWTYQAGVWTLRQMLISGASAQAEILYRNRPYWRRLNSSHGTVWTGGYLRRRRRCRVARHTGKRLAWRARLLKLYPELASDELLPPEAGATVTQPECCRAVEEAFDAWITRWPKHCTKCGSRGYLSNYYDPVGDGIAYIDDADACPECTGTPVGDGDEDGHCPRCRVEMRIDQATPCPACGWAWGKGDDDYLPETTCYCWQDEADEGLAEAEGQHLSQLYAPDALPHVRLSGPACA